MFENRPKCASVDRIIGLTQVNKANVHRVVILSSFLHQHPKGKKLVHAPPALAETTLVLAQENLSSGLDPDQKNAGKHLAGDAQEGNTPVVVAFRSTALLVKGDDEMVEPI